MSLKKSPRILVYVGLDLIGDGLMKLSFLKALRGLYPEAHITWFAGKGKSVFATTLAPIVTGLLDEVQDNILYGSNFWEFLRPLPFKDQSFDIIIDTQNRVNTTLFLKRIPHNIFISSSANFFFSDRKPFKGKKKSLHLQERLLDLVRLLKGSEDIELKRIPLNIPQKEEELAKKLLPAQNYIGLIPGASVRRKCWPLERYIDLAARIKQKDFTPVFILGPQEKDWEDILKEKASFALFPLQDKLAGEKPSLFLTMAIGKRLFAAVTNDCGPGHILASVDTPLVSLFGPTNAEKFYPFSPYLTLLKAQKWGGIEMNSIPIEAVKGALFALLQTIPKER